MTWDFLADVLNRALGTLEAAGIQRCSWAGSIRGCKATATGEFQFLRTERKKTGKKRARRPVTEDYKAQTEAQNKMPESEQR